MNRPLKMYLGWSFGSYTRMVPTTQHKLAYSYAYCIYYVATEINNDCKCVVRDASGSFSLHIRSTCLHSPFLSLSFSVPSNSIFSNCLVRLYQRFGLPTNTIPIYAEYECLIYSFSHNWKMVYFLFPVNNANVNCIDSL